MIDKIKKIDTAFSFFILRFYRFPMLNCGMKTISTLGNHGEIWVTVILISLFYKRTRMMAWHMLIALALTTLISQYILKGLVKRKRPCHHYRDVKLLVNMPLDTSFPSSHTSSSFACSTVIFCYDPHLGIVAMIFAALMGFSRIYLFVHYLSDVLMGTFLGALIGYLVVYFI